jgi:hypothetical protein
MRILQPSPICARPLAAAAPRPGHSPLAIHHLHLHSPLRVDSHGHSPLATPHSPLGECPSRQTTRHLPASATTTRHSESPLARLATRHSPLTGTRDSRPLATRRRSRRDSDTPLATPSRQTTRRQSPPVTRHSESPLATRHSPLRVPSSIGGRSNSVGSIELCESMLGSVYLQPPNSAITDRSSSKSTLGGKIKTSGVTRVRRSPPQGGRATLVSKHELNFGLKPL